MIERELITDPTTPLFEFCWELYLASFPEEERRHLDYHIEAMQRAPFKFEVIKAEGQPIGVIGWWQLDHFRYIEHLATSPTVRGKGYGKEILTQFAAESDTPVLLEVEHPTTAISQRRIHFYERVGFHLNPHYYAHPSYQQIEGEEVNLLVMTYSSPIALGELKRFMTEEFPVIHFRSF